MSRSASLTPEESDIALPRGISCITSLPKETFGELWDSIIIDPDTKRHLLSQAILNFTIRNKVPRTVIPLHGVILLVGEPGTGKTSLAKGLASRTAESLTGAPFKYMEVEPHSLTSSAMGKTQRAVLDLFTIAITETASNGPTIVLLDEVETLAVDRSKLSLDANPIDIHRATDVVLVQLDALAERLPNLLFIATSNFPKAIDSAFMSRCDLILRIPLPNAEACEHIMSNTLHGMAKSFPKLKELTNDKHFTKCASECVGLDGRTIRKVVASALARDPQTAMDPNKLTIGNLMAAIKAAKFISNLQRAEQL